MEDLARVGRLLSLRSILDHGPQQNGLGQGRPPTEQAYIRVSLWGHPRNPMLEPYEKSLIRSYRPPRKGSRKSKEVAKDHVLRIFAGWVRKKTETEVLVVQVWEAAAYLDELVRNE